MKTPAPTLKPPIALSADATPSPSHNLFAALCAGFPADAAACAVETDTGLRYSWQDLMDASAMLANLLDRLHLRRFKWPDREQLFRLCARRNAAVHHLPGTNHRFLRRTGSATRQKPRPFDHQVTLLRAARSHHSRMRPAVPPCRP